MKVPKRLQPLVDEGIIDKVIRRMMSGKEADLYIVQSGRHIRCAKIYKEANKRSFKQATQYQEGRKVRNTRRARAMEKGSKFGRQQQEEAWQNAEVDALYRLAHAGVRVPEPYGCFDGVLLMELITDNNGEVAPRLNDVHLTAEQAQEDHSSVLRSIIRMLSCGVIHGDLSEFNVLLDPYGPVIIDLPQAVDAAANNHAKSMLTRDVNNITNYYAQYAPDLAKNSFAAEIWKLFEDGELHPDTELSGNFVENSKSADVDAIMLEIKAAMEEEQERLQRLQSA